MTDDVNAHLRDVPCRCGHMLDEHNGGFGQFHAPCLNESCRCDDYYPDYAAKRSS